MRVRSAFISQRNLVSMSTPCENTFDLLKTGDRQMQAGDILGHEWMGVVDDVGSDIKNVKKGDRVVASFQIAYVSELVLSFSPARLLNLLS